MELYSVPSIKIRFFINNADEDKNSYVSMEDRGFHKVVI